jgi:glycerol-3-phosphate dehydrogenase (NAD(P)+)
MSIGVIGAGAFGTALAVAWARDGRDVMLWGRDVATLIATRVNPRLEGVTLPDALTVTRALDDVFAQDILILAIPAQTLRGFLETHRAALEGRVLIAACKGIDLTTMTGPVANIAQMIPSAQAGILTGPSFAADIARGLPTALTLAVSGDAEALQTALATQTLRIYRTGDTVGAELGGALKNVMAIACGVTIGAGLGESARAALMTRGFAEMQRLAGRLGADETTLSGLAGFGDLALTCTSDGSRNYRLGLALGQGTAFDPNTTVEGAATAKAVRALSQKLDIDMPICTVVADLIDKKTSVAEALDALLSRPLKEE